MQNIIQRERKKENIKNNRSKYIIYSYLIAFVLGNEKVNKRELEGKGRKYRKYRKLEVCSWKKESNIYYIHNNNINTTVVKYLFVI